MKANIIFFATHKIILRAHTKIYLPINVIVQLNENVSKKINWKRRLNKKLWWTHLNHFYEIEFVKGPAINNWKIKINTEFELEGEKKNLKIYLFTLASVGLFSTETDALVRNRLQCSLFGTLIYCKGAIKYKSHLFFQFHQWFFLHSKIRYFVSQKQFGPLWSPSKNISEIENRAVTSLFSSKGNHQV